MNMQIPLSELQGKAKLDIPDSPELPEIIPGSELQLDGDISCYYAAWLDIPLSACIKQLKKHIETKRLLAGFAVVNVHTTQGLKSGREDIARVNMYQDTRRKYKSPEKTERIRELRNFLQTYKTETVNPMPSFTMEADDTMNIRQRQCIKENIDSAIMTKDKDLDMCPGMHITYDNLEEYIVPDGYGKLWLEETREPNNSKRGYAVKKKIKGIGTAFFWVQTLMGDTADSIPGLPIITGELLNKYSPTKATEKALAAIANPKTTNKQLLAAHKVLQKRKDSSLGQITAYNMLKHCTSDKQAFKIVKHAYKAYYGENQFDFTSWRGNTTTQTSGTMLLEQARLLWMLRTEDDDVTKFLQERAI